MKPSVALYLGVVAHATLIGLLMGLSMSPIVGVVLPLLLGFGSLRLLDSLGGSPATPVPKGPQLQLPSGIGWMVALWCSIVLASVLLGIGIRNGTFQARSAPIRTLSLMNLSEQPAWRIAELSLVCEYYDRLDLKDDERRAVARALSDTTQPTGPILSTLQVYFTNNPSPPKKAPSPFGVWEYGQGVVR